MRTRLALMCLLVLTAGCSDGGTGGVASTASPSSDRGTGGVASTASPTASPTPPPPEVVIAAILGDAGVGLYRISADGQAHLLRRLQPPSGRDRVLGLTLSGSPAPDTCVVWQKPTVDGPYDADSAQLWCYRFGDATGLQIPVTGSPTYYVALRADGRALSWAAWPTPHGADSSDDQDLVTARYTEGRVSEVRRHAVVRAGGEPVVDTGCGEWVAGIAWAGERLLIECNGSNDEPGGLELQALDLRGKASSVEDLKWPPYNYYRGAVGADATSALVIQGEYCEITCDDGKPAQPSRAVRVDLATGRVLEVIATSARGRFMLSVSGGPKGIVYVTGNGRARAVYVRFPGEKHGTRVNGLPDTADDVIAQP